MAELWKVLEAVLKFHAQVYNVLHTKQWKQLSTQPFVNCVIHERAGIPFVGPRHNGSGENPYIVLIAFNKRESPSAAKLITLISLLFSSLKMYCHHFRTCSYVNLLSLPTLPTHARVKDGAPSFNGVAVYKYEYLAIEWSVNIFAISSNVLAINEFVL